MKFLCTVLFLALPLIAYTQSQAPEQTIARSATPQQDNAQPQPPQQPNPPPPPPKAPTTSHQVRHPARFYRWELTGGYAHITGDQGLNGFNVGGSVFLNPNISMGFNYDGVYNNSVLGTFALTNVGLTISKSHLQNFLAGPRVYFPGVFRFAPNCGLGVKGAKPKLHPFVEAQFGESNLYSQVTTTNLGTVSSANTAFTWVLGGGADFNFAEHWFARFNADLVRTHFAYEGQSRLRIILGVAARF